MLFTNIKFYIIMNYYKLFLFLRLNIFHISNIIYYIKRYLNIYFFLFTRNNILNLHRLQIFIYEFENVI